MGPEPLVHDLEIVSCEGLEGSERIRQASCKC
jgi:hypothetical protein